MNLENIVRDINHEQPLLLQLYCQLIDMSSFAHRKMIGGLIHDNHAIAERNRPRNFECLLFPPESSAISLSTSTLSRNPKSWTTFALVSRIFFLSRNGRPKTRLAVSRPRK